MGPPYQPEWLSEPLEPQRRFNLCVSIYIYTYIYIYIHVWSTKGTKDIHMPMCVYLYMYMYMYMVYVPTRDTQRESRPTDSRNKHGVWLAASRSHGRSRTPGKRQIPGVAHIPCTEKVRCSNVSFVVLPYSFKKIK